MANYVKFMRGTPKAYDDLRIKEMDTLYFISETDAITGKLYVGNKLINSELTFDDLKIYLNKLEDVDLTGAKQNNLLGYDISSGKWIPMEIETLVSIPLMIGATLEQPGKEGLVPAPLIGDQQKFLRGDGTWAVIQQEAGLKFKKVNSIEEIDITAKDANKYIYLVAKGAEYEEYFVIDNKIETIGYLSGALDNYATKEDLKLIDIGIGNLNTSLLEIDSKISNIEDSLNSFISKSEYTEKIKLIDADIAQLKKSTHWGNL